MNQDITRAIEALQREISEAHLTALDRTRITAAAQVVIAAFVDDAKQEEDPTPCP